MKRLLFAQLLLLLLFCFACFAPAFAAAPGDLAASHVQQISAGDALPVAADGGASATVGVISSVVTAVAPLVPAPYGGLIPLLFPLIGIAVNFWYRWRGKDIENTKEKRRKQLLVEAIAYAEELGAAAKKTGDAVDKLAAAAEYVSDNDTGKDPLFGSMAGIRKQLTAYLGRITGVGATGNSAI